MLNNHKLLLQRRRITTKELIFLGLCNRTVNLTKKSPTTQWYSTEFNLSLNDWKYFLIFVINIDNQKIVIQESLKLLKWKIKNKYIKTTCDSEVVTNAKSRNNHSYEKHKHIKGRIRLHKTCIVKSLFWTIYRKVLPQLCNTCEFLFTLNMTHLHIWFPIIFFKIFAFFSTASLQLLLTAIILNVFLKLYKTCILLIFISFSLSELLHQFLTIKNIFLFLLFFCLFLLLNKLFALLMKLSFCFDFNIFLKLLHFCLQSLVILFNWFKRLFYWVLNGKSFFFLLN